MTFERAATIFLDPQALSQFDDEHSAAEERWITLGLDTIENKEKRVLSLEPQNLHVDVEVSLKLDSGRQSSLSPSIQAHQA